MRIDDDIKKLLKKDSFYEVIPKSIIRMGLNENFLINEYFLRTILMEALQNVDVRAYPDAKGAKAARAIAEDLGIWEDEVIVGNGSDEIIDLIAKVFIRRGLAFIIDPTFEMYKFYVELYGGKVKSILTDENFNLRADIVLSQIDDVKAIFICSPNNPTGNQFKKDEIMKIIKEFNGLIILDEAYADFAPYSLIMDATKYNNLIVLRSFSKAYGLAGLRIGYAVSNNEIISYLKAAQSPYSVNSIAQEVCKLVLNNKQVFKSFIKSVIEERVYLTAELSMISGIKAYPSDANFILIRSLALPSSYICEELKKHDILVRDRSNLPLLDNCFRVTVGRKSDNMKFIEGLKRILEETS
ncbi:MAG: histidinol-phosphate transaminase [Candidatus Methanomethyliaceae archaeon]|nr:histidinol-phosphate transaminase [Candidatus Methanomethyliaceae archaeon]MDW7970768.1 histidinol-phosphate transaminase [Nitrososphaerota archaeon]